MGGVIRRSGSTTSSPKGLSPRGRSHHPSHSLRRVKRGSISAWAESSANQAAHHSSWKVYLRVGGVITSDHHSSPPKRGLSPRGRSHRPFAYSVRSDLGSISAWAESSSVKRTFRALQEVYLRVGGVICSVLCVFVWYQGLSPRGRSHLPMRYGLPKERGSISAWAESSLRQYDTRTVSAIAYNTAMALSSPPLLPF